MALEDAAVLASLLKAGLDTGTFERFEQQRKSRTTEVQARSRKLGKIYHAQGVAAAARNAALRLAGARLTARQTSWLYEWSP